MPLKIRCPRHPRYSGRRSPRASCQGCIELYNIRLKAQMLRLEIVEKQQPDARAAQGE
jgi:hypothetical protein